jgi:hypothetical protein
MRNDVVLQVALAVAGAAAVLIGIHQELVHVAPGYEGTIMTGWGGSLNHEERLLARVGVVGLAGAVGALRWERLFAVPVAAGGVVLFYALRAIHHWTVNETLYAETSTYDGSPIAYVFGAEPFLLVAGGLLLVGAGLVGRRRHPSRDESDEPARSSIA